MKSIFALLTLMMAIYANTSIVQNSPRSSDHFSSIADARAYVADGSPNQLFTARFPFPMLICAATYLDKYGTDERYNFLPLVDKLSLPTLFTYGQIELESGSVAFDGLPDAIAAQATNETSIQITTVPGADHFYTGKYGELADVMAAWVLAELPPV